MAVEVEGMWIPLLMLSVAGAWFVTGKIGADLRVGRSPWPLFERPRLTARERRLHLRISAIYPDHIVLAQIQLTRLIDFAPKSDAEAVTADLVLCRRDCSVVAVIHVDEAAQAPFHTSIAAARKSKAIRAAGLRPVRIEAGAMPSPGQLARLLKEPVSSRVAPPGVAYA